VHSLAPDSEFPRQGGLWGAGGRLTIDETLVLELA
jgi:hypothetical protein